MQGFEKRQREIREIRRKSKYFYIISGGIFLVALGVWIGWQIFPAESLTDYKMGLWHGLLSAGLTVLVLDRLNEHRSRQQLRGQLIRQMASPHNGLALQAVWELIANDWTRDGSLREKYFTSANLENATLLSADLQGSYFTGANLKNASLPHANMKTAHLDAADLREAYLWNANLEKARLIHADLRRARLSGANLCGAYLGDADLRWATFIKHFHVFNESYVAQLDASTILPDGTNYDPDLGLDQLERFTNPDHPQFWGNRDEDDMK